MVDITNGINSITVTKGAFEGIYRHQGYTLVHDYSAAGPTISDKAPVIVNDNNYLTDDKALPMTDLEVLEETPVYDGETELLEKPIGQWTQEELKSYAEENGISLEGVTKTREVRNKIKDFIDSQK